MESSRSDIERHKLVIRSDRRRYIEGRRNLMIIRVDELAAVRAGLREEWKFDKDGLTRARYDRR